MDSSYSHLSGLSSEILAAKLAESGLEAGLVDQLRSKSHISVSLYVH